MHMFCYQCQETAPPGCRLAGTCGKTDEAANNMDLLIFVVRGICVIADRAVAAGREIDSDVGDYLFRSFYMTVTNTNFDPDRVMGAVREGLAIKARILNDWLRPDQRTGLPEPATWHADDLTALRAKSYRVGVLETTDEDLRSVREMITYGFKGISAYAHHATELGRYPRRVANEMVRILAATTGERTLPELLQLAMDTGRAMLWAMEDLDAANAAVYGEPRVTTFSIDVGTRPGILVTGHDLTDMQQLLEQSAGQGVDIYTHSEMISAHYYPSLKKHTHLLANYGNAWWKQDVEFASFNGPILVTTNCIVPVKDEYKDRIFTTGVAGYPGVPHVATGPDGKKDFSAIIRLAKTCPSPTAIDRGTAIGGFNHRRLVENADKVLDLVKRGKIKRFIVMGGCDGRDLRRDYYRDVAKALPKDAVILTAGCAKYMYYKLGLGDIEGLPRVLEAGQCNDCYSLVAFALKVQQALGVKDINELPISYDIAWYDQKAVGILMTLLYMGVRGIRLGPTLPAFVSDNVLKVLVDKWDLKLIGTVEGDVAAMMAGR